MSAPHPLVLINPRSGGGLGSRALEGLRDIPGIVTRTIEDRQHIDITQYSDVIVCGGDGTVRSAIVDVMERSPGSTVLPIPLGTANDFCREWGWRRPRSLREIEDRIQSIHSFPIAWTTVWKVSSDQESSEHINFINYFSIGVDAAIVSEFDAWRSARSVDRQPSVLRNRLQYVLTSLRQWKFTLPVVTVSTSNRSYSRSNLASIFLANTDSVLGLGSVGHGTSASDSLLTAVALGHPTAFLGFLPIVRYLPWAREGLGRAETWEISWSSSPLSAPLLPAQADGEPFKLSSESSLKISRAGRVRIRTGF